MSAALFSVWNSDELRQALMPTLEKLYRQEPDSLPFKQPVDAMALQIPVRDEQGLYTPPSHLRALARDCLPL